jgi:hypothetical protein
LTLPSSSCRPSYPLHFLSKHAARHPDLGPRRR